MAPGKTGRFNKFIPQGRTVNTKKQVVLHGKHANLDLFFKYCPLFYFVIYDFLR